MELFGVSGSSDSSQLIFDATSVWTLTAYHATTRKHRLDTPIDISHVSHIDSQECGKFSSK